MEIMKNIKWYHIIVICIFVLLFLFIINNNDTTTAKQTEQYESVKQEQTPSNDPYVAEIVLYYAMWCGYSKAFLPEWQKFEEYAKANLKNVRVTALQCVDGNEATCQQKGVEGYPTVILYPKNKSAGITFEGERNMESLIKFVNNNI